MTDPVEMLKIFHQPNTYDELVNLLPPPRSQEELYTSLDARHVERLVAHALECIARDDTRQAEDVACCLACFADADIGQLLEAFVARESYYPGQAFRGASAAIRDRLITLVDADAANRDHQLLCLAWIGDGTVADLFAAWRRNPPAWRSQVNIPPEEYSLWAGWELAPDDRRRDLFLPECHALVPTTGDSPVVLGRPASERCPWCGRFLTSLLSLDLGAPVLGWLPVAGLRDLQVPTCSVCTCYGTVFGRIDARRDPWHPANVRPGHLPDDSASWPEIPTAALTVSVRRSPYHAASWSLPTSYTQVGGHPTWIQDAYYPECPECSRRMVFIGQVSGDDLEDLGEGIYYAFVCLQCQVSATLYQQT